jgi:hypothetical protein
MLTYGHRRYCKRMEWMGLCLLLWSVLSFPPAFSAPGLDYFFTESYPDAPVGSVKTGDLNGDRFDDLIILQPGSVSILLNNGKGKFHDRFDTPIASSLGKYLAISDLNRDGKIDLVIAMYQIQGGDDTGALILLGRGNGTFEAGVQVGAGENPNSLEISDFNHDGNPDLALAQYGENGSGTRHIGIGVYMGKGDGTFAEMVLYQPVVIPEVIPYFIAAGDFNGDNWQDMAVSGSSTGYLLMNQGDGTFLPEKVGNHYFGVELLAADFNRDGLSDLVVHFDANRNYFYDQLNIWLTQRNGDFVREPWEPPTNNLARYFTKPALGDFNGDGFIDLLTFSQGMYVLVNKGNGTVERSSFQGATRGNCYHAHGTLGDLNADGVSDIVYYCAEDFIAFQLQVALSQPPGSDREPPVTKILVNEKEPNKNGIGPYPCFFSQAYVSFKVSDKGTGVMGVYFSLDDPRCSPDNLKACSFRSAGDLSLSDVWFKLLPDVPPIF